MTLKGLRRRTDQLIQFGAARKIAKISEEDAAHALLKNPHASTQSKADTIAAMLGKQKRKPQHGIEGSNDVGTSGM